MSCTMNVKIEMNDKTILEQVCDKLDLEWSEGKHDLHNKKRVEGIGIKLPGWIYPVIVQPNGKAVYDNYNPNGASGKMTELHKLTNEYGYEKARIAAAMKGYSTQRVECQNGNIQLQVMVAA